MKNQFCLPQTRGVPDWRVNPAGFVCTLFIVPLFILLHCDLTSLCFIITVNWMEDFGLVQRKGNLEWTDKTGMDYTTVLPV